MTFTYDSTSASVTDLAEVRRWIGDTDSSDPLLTDEEINRALSIKGSTIRAAILCLQWVLAEFGRKVDRSVVGVNTSLGAKYDRLKTLLVDLKAEAAESSTGVYLGGTSDTRKDSIESDTDFNQPFGKVGIHDHPGLRPDNLDPDTND